MEFCPRFHLWGREKLSQSWELKHNGQRIEFSSVFHAFKLSLLIICSWTCPRRKTLSPFNYLPCYQSPKFSHLSLHCMKSRRPESCSVCSATITSHPLRNRNSQQTTKRIGWTMILCILTDTISLKEPLKAQTERSTCWNCVVFVSPALCPKDSTVVHQSPTKWRPVWAMSVSECVYQHNTNGRKAFTESQHLLLERSRKKKNLANEKKKGKFLNLIRDSTTYLTASIIFNIKIMKAFLLKWRIRQGFLPSHLYSILLLWA